MSKPTRAQQNAYLRTWREDGPLLEAIRDQEIREADTASSIRLFDQAFRIALRDLPLRPSSGLVEWQEAMGRLRRHD